MKLIALLITLAITATAQASGCPSNEQYAEVGREKYYMETLEITPGLPSSVICSTVAHIIFVASDRKKDPAILLIISSTAGDYWAGVILELGVIDVFVEDRRVE